MSPRWRKRAVHSVLPSSSHSTSPAQPEATLGDLVEGEPPELRWLHAEGDGPYYLAPDSAPPLPSGMWSELDADEVEQAAKEVAKLWGKEDWQVGNVDDDVRTSLARDGELGERVIELLDAQWGPDRPSGS